MKNELKSLELTMEKFKENQEFLATSQMNLFENFNKIIENLTQKVENHDLVIKNQSLIINNQDVIVTNQLNIINNQKKIVENQVTLSVILQTQAKVLFLLNKIAGDKNDMEEINNQIREMYKNAKMNFNNNNLDDIIIPA